MADLISGIAPQIDTYANWVSANPTLGKDSGGKSFSQMIFATGAPVGDIVIWGNDQTFTVSYAARQYIVINPAPYSTGWVANSDWTNAEFTINHALTDNLSDLIVKFYISTDGTEANAFEIHDTGVNGNYGYTLYQIDTANVMIQTGALGLVYIDGSGVAQVIDTESWYYKGKVYKLS